MNARVTSPSKRVAVVICSMAPSLPLYVVRHLGAVLGVEAGGVAPGGDRPGGVHDHPLQTEELPRSRADVGAIAEVGGQAGSVQRGGAQALAVDRVERRHGVSHADQACGKAGNLGEVAPSAVGLMVGHHITNDGAGCRRGENRRQHFGETPTASRQG